MKKRALKKLPVTIRCRWKYVVKITRQTNAIVERLNRYYQGRKKFEYPQYTGDMLKAFLKYNIR